MSSQLKILLEDNHLLVLEKPALIATMGVAQGEPSFLEEAKEYIRTKYNKPGNVYLGVVSRLDSFVSGAIVFARTSKAASRLSAQMRAGTIEKKYWAIVPGRLPVSTGTLEHFVYKDDKQRRMFASEKEVSNSKFAKLHFSVIAEAEFNGETDIKNAALRPEKVSLIEVRLETGRKHQIRVQLSSLGFPIVGDRKYGSKLMFKKGIALHCRSLQFEHPTQKTRINIESLPPAWWNLSRFGIS